MRRYKLLENVGQYAALHVIIHLGFRINSTEQVNLAAHSVRPANNERDVLLRADIFQAQKIELFIAFYPERPNVVLILELQGQHTHSDEITAMNAFKTFRDDSPDPQ